MAVVRWLRPPPYKRLSLANKRAFSIIAEIPIAELEMKRRIRVCEREDCTLAAWYRSIYAPRTGGADDSHHRTAGIAGRTRRRGGRVAARGARKTKAVLVWEEVMPTLVGFGTFAALPEEQISEKISRRILSGDQG